MREYKFRGKRLDTGEWVFGNLIISSKLHFYISLYAYDGSEWNQCPLQLNCVKVDPETVGQYTGLRDDKRTEEYPDGQEIYEHDLLGHEDEAPLDVYFDDGYFAVCPDGAPVPLIDWLAGAEVVGNIHDKENMKDETN